ncbi:ankyrin repeat domain-containing protein, partial [Wolbachia endosymbiont of Pentidionis agamae]|uniref:ankyrin repeat domain-containing protein n=1 Tax=Wolbachia endosymbiont of Pentidionis agamae TaxID=3110435 RepID=UPI002FD43B7B
MKQLIEKGVYVNVRDHIGNTPLHIAAMNENKDIVGLLIKAGADCKIQNSAQKTPSDLTIHQTIKTMIENCMDKEEMSQRLFKAIDDRNLEAFENLLNNGADVNVKNSEGAPILLYRLYRSDIYDPFRLDHSI